MDDEADAQTLFAILTNPNPTGVDPEDPYGLADDGIDRYDGFGRDVWVKALQVVYGEHGAELLVEFGLKVPSDSQWWDVPPDGSLRVPFDAEWRELSGYSDPAAFAPVVAQRVLIAAHLHVERHRQRPGELVGTDGGRAALPGRDAPWQMLLDGVRGEGDVRQVAPGRIELQIAGETVIALVVSPSQWEQVL